MLRHDKAHYLCYPTMYVQRQRVHREHPVCLSRFSRRVEHVACSLGIAQVELFQQLRLPPHPLQDLEAASPELKVLVQVHTHSEEGRTKNLTSHTPTFELKNSSTNPPEGACFKNRNGQSTECVNPQFQRQTKRQEMKKIRNQSSVTDNQPPPRPQGHRVL